MEYLYVSALVVGLTVVFAILFGRWLNQPRTNAGGQP
jgi:hypothetical protein